ncbi:sensory box protein, partial [mine drainage metagenome]
MYCLVEQPRGTLWIGTNLGIAALDTVNGRIVHYGQRDGINGMESNAGTCTRLKDGSIAFGGPEGFVIGAASRKPSDLPNTVQLTALRIGDEGERVPPRDGSLRVALGQPVRIQFASLDYRHPAAGLYRYRLLGRGTRWSAPAPAPTHGVSYVDLDAGRYTFEVAASTGTMTTPPARLAIIVVPPWWDSPAMRALYALLAGGVVLLLIGMTWSRRRTERRYRLDSAAREERLKLALWGSGDALWELDLQRGVLRRMGDLHLLGGPREDVLTIEDWRRYAVHPDDLPHLEQTLAEHLAGHTPFYESEHRLRGADGQWIWIRARGKVSESDAEGRPLRVIGTSRDISSELARERERSIADLVVRSMGEAVAVTDARMRFVAVNPAFTRMIGYTGQDILGQPSSLLDSPDQPEAFVQVHAKLESSGHFSGELWQRKRDGEPILCRIEINEIRDGHGQRTHFVAVLTDVTARRRAEQELHYLANYDPLTGLPNRTLLTERLGDAILRARQMGRLVAVLFVDLDRFKHVNDAHGHSVGDRVLQAAGRRLRAVVRDDDTVARLGGDEFTVVLERVAQTRDAEDIAQKLLEVFAEPMDLGEGREAQISLSIGIALYPLHGLAPTDLLKYADIAMYRAKERGRNTYAVYTEALDTEVRQRADLIVALQRALKREELHLVYQPKLNLAENRITGVEALLRWHSEEFGNIPPSLFIPLAEEIGLISTLGEFVIERACAELAAWRAAGLTDVTMAVNLSAAQLARGDIS